MLKDQDRIFQNLYNDKGSDLISSKERGDWKDTKALCEKGKEWIINEIKASELKRKRWSWFSDRFKMVLCSKRDWIQTTLHWLLMLMNRSLAHAKIEIY